MDLGLTRDQLARRLGVHRNSIMHWEADRMLPAPRFRSAVDSVIGSSGSEAAIAARSIV
jgi:transcriptional regulator with XRE-family HTH domain